jgi:TnpA family transposase
MPRIKDLTDQRIYKLDRSADHGSDIEKLFSGYIDIDLIREQWDSIIRIIASLKDKTAPANLIVGKLARALPGDRLAKAIMQLGRLVKTIFIFRYLSMNHCDKKFRSNSTVARPDTSLRSGYFLQIKVSFVQGITRK